MVSEGIEMVRYADDFVILCKTAADAARALELVQQWVAENGLTLHPQKTRIVDSRTELFDFLGYSFRDQNHWPRKKSIKKFRDAIRGKTRRTRGRSLHCTIRDVNLTLRGWFGYFKHSTYRTIFREQDAWVRMRLRSILRRFQHRKGRGRGSDHQRWPNAFFVEHGLLSLVAARASAVQSSQR
jgi:RNA-directed DNA polymerase